MVENAFETMFNSKCHRFSISSHRLPQFFSMILPVTGNHKFLSLIKDFSPDIVAERRARWVKVEVRMVKRGRVTHLRDLDFREALWS